MKAAFVPSSNSGSNSGSSSSSGSSSGSDYGSSSGSGSGTSSGSLSENDRDQVYANLCSSVKRVMAQNGNKLSDTITISLEEIMKNENIKNQFINIILKQLDSIGNDQDYIRAMNSKIEYKILEAVANYINSRLLNSNIDAKRIKEILNHKPDIISDNEESNETPNIVEQEQEGNLEMENNAPPPL